MLKNKFPDRITYFVSPFDHIGTKYIQSKTLFHCYYAILIIIIFKQIGYLRELNGNQILSKEWVKASHTPDEKHISSSEENLKMEYGYQFWLPLEDNGDSDYLAIGVRGQFIYINPKFKSVIATSTAFPSDGASAYGFYVYQMIEVFRDISRHYSR